MFPHPQAIILEIFFYLKHFPRDPPTSIPHDLWHIVLPDLLRNTLKRIRFLREKPAGASGASAPSGNKVAAVDDSDDGPHGVLKNAGASASGGAAASAGGAGEERLQHFAPLQGSNQWLGRLMTEGVLGGSHLVEDVMEVRGRRCFASPSGAMELRNSAAHSHAPACMPSMDSLPAICSPWDGLRTRPYHSPFFLSIASEIHMPGLP